MRRCASRRSTFAAADLCAALAAKELDGVFIANRYRGIDGFVDSSCAQTVITFDYGATWSMIPQPKSYPRAPSVAPLMLRRCI